MYGCLIREKDAPKGGERAVEDSPWLADGKYISATYGISAGQPKRLPEVSGDL